MESWPHRWLGYGDKQDRKKGAAAQSIIPGIRDTRPAVKSAFLAARDLAPSVKKKKSRQDDNVDRREFHALLVYLRYYLELQILFQDLDTSEDLRISKDDDLRFHGRFCLCKGAFSAS